MWWNPNNMGFGGDMGCGNGMGGFNPGYPEYSGYPQQPCRSKITKKDIINYVCCSFGTDNYVLVDEFETLRARHICEGSTSIEILEKRFFSIPTPEGYINVELFFCEKCRKLIINRTSLDLV